MMMAMIMSDVCRLPFADADAADDNLKCVFTSPIHMCITIICTFFFSPSLSHFISLARSALLCMLFVFLELDECALLFLITCVLHSHIDR